MISLVTYEREAVGRLALETDLELELTSASTCPTMLSNRCSRCFLRFLHFRIVGETRVVHLGLTGGDGRCLEDRFSLRGSGTRNRYWILSGDAVKSRLISAKMERCYAHDRNKPGPAV